MGIGQTGVEVKECGFFENSNPFGWLSRNLKSNSGRSGERPVGRPPARLRRALGKAEPVFEALRLRLGLQILPASLTLRQAPSVLANATSKEIKKSSTC